MNVSSGYIIVLLFVAALFGSAQAAQVSGELKQWHAATLTFDGPQSSETATPNPFTDYRLDVTFTGPSGQTYRVPGYYAADGNAGNSGSASGNKWMVKFCPDAAGAWNYLASFVQGAGIAAQLTGGASAGYFDADAGSFVVAGTDKPANGIDLRGKGKLEYVNQHYLRFRSGDYFIKAGSNIPETFLEYNDFDGTPQNLDYSTHVADWHSGDPSWMNGKGKGIIGALNYLSGLGVNSMYFLTLNNYGDGKKAWPWTSTDNYYNYDCSKLDQWDVVFSHMDKLGMMLHVALTETENEVYFEVKELGTANGFAPSRKIYYRELVARFGYHCAVTWNLGEESGWNDAGGYAVGSTTQQRKDWADYIRQLTYYKDNITVHNGPSSDDSIYAPLLGYSSLTGVEVQWTQGTAVHQKVLEWWNKSHTNGHQWVVSLDEPWVSPTTILTDFRKYDVWGSYLAGAGGCEYFQDGTGQIDEFRPHESFYTTLVRAQRFIQENVPYSSMEPKDSLVSGVTGYCLAKTGRIYLVYLPAGGAASLNLTGANGTFDVSWFDPRNGGGLQAGSVGIITGGTVVSLGNPPNNTGSDWTVLVRDNASASGAGTVTFNNAEAITIPDAGTGTPYPSTINVSGMSGTIGTVTVTLNGLNHTWGGDIDVLVVGPAGQKVIMLSDAGTGSTANNANLTFSGSAAATLPETGSLVSGTYKPTDYGPIDTFPSPAPAGPYATTLSTFNGTTPSGTWSLYVFDDGAGDQGSFAGGWSLSITTTEPANPTPTISHTPDQTTVVNTATAAIPFTVNDTDTPVGNLTLSANSSNPALATTNNIVFGGSGANRTVTVTPAAGQSGTATITVSVSDGVLSASNSFVLTVNAAAPIAAVRVNAGGGAFTDSAGNTWSADSGFNTGGTYSTTSAINNTLSDALYQTERWDASTNPELTYSFNLPNGSYLANLHFAEIYSENFGVGRRVFDVLIEGQLRIDDLDIYSRVGASTALIISVPVTVNDGQLNIQFVHGVENSKISAIEVLSAPAPPTISNIPDQSTVVNTATPAIPFTVNDPDTPVNNLTLSATSSNPALAPTNNIVFGESGADRTVTITPAPDQIGTTTITLIASKGTLAASNSFLVTVGRWQLTLNGITAKSKVYDGTNTVALDLSGATLAGAINGEDVTLVTMGASASFADERVGEAKPVQIVGLTLSGADATNYTLTQPTTWANITAAALTVNGITARSKVYDGTNTVALDLNGALLVGAINGDDVTLVTADASAAFADEHVGNDKPVQIAGLTLSGADATNYTLTQPTTWANITAAALTVNGITVRSKVYDGTNTVALDLSGALLVGAINGDDVTLVTAGASATFADENVGNDKVVQIAGLSLSGTDATNYTLTQPATLANITAAALTVNGIPANNKVYDGTNTVAFDLRGALLVGAINGDDVTLVTAGASATFADENVGNDKPVQIVGLTLSGTDATNYTLTQPATLANITAAALTMNGITATNKVYDGTNTVAFDLRGALLVGAINGDDVTLVTAGASATFADENVGNDKPVQIVGLTLSGTDATNYTLTQPATLANITAAALTVTTDSTNRIYGAANPLFTGTVSGVQNSDTITATYATTAAATSPVGTYAIVPMLYDPDGRLGNYSVASNNGLLTITAAGAAGKSSVSILEPTRITSIIIDDQGAVRVTVVGEVGHRYALEASSDLINWSKVDVQDNTTGSIGFVDRPATNAMRFYRAVSTPK